MKSGGRADDVFSQINIGPYFLGTGPGAINDMNHFSSYGPTQRGRQPNFNQANYNNGNTYPRGRDDRSNAGTGSSGAVGGGNYGSDRSNFMAPPPPPMLMKRDSRDYNKYPPGGSAGGAAGVNGMPNGMGSGGPPRDIQNLPPRLQRQYQQQGGNIPFQGVPKPELELRPMNAPKPMYNNSMNNGNNNFALGPRPIGGGANNNFPQLKPMGPYSLNNNQSSNKFAPRPSFFSNGRESNDGLINGLGQLKVNERDPSPKSQQQTSPAESKIKVDYIAEAEKLLNAYLKNEDAEELIKFVKTNLAEIKFDDLLLLIMRVSIGTTDHDRELATKLINKLRVDDIVSKPNFLKALKTLFTKVSELEVETPRARSFVAAYVANAIIEEVITLKEVGELLESGQHYPLFPLVLQNLHRAKDQTWLFEAFTESHINLINMLPEADRNKERMADILEDRNLTFLYPMLRIESDITRLINSEEGCTPASLYRWLKDNVNLSLQSTPEFISVVFTTLLKNLVAKFGLSQFGDQSKEFEKYRKMFLHFLLEKPDLQLVVLYALQTYCSSQDFPKGLLEKWFNMLYELEIVEEEVFFRWKEDINDEYPGKGRALFQVNKWLTWLAETDDDSEEEEDEE